MNSGSSNSSTPDDHGLNMEPVPASYDNLDLLLVRTEIGSGPSSSHQTLYTATGEEMVTKLTILVLLAQLHRAYNIPLRQFREPKAAHGVPLLIQHHQTALPQTHALVTPTRVKKSPNIFSIPLSQIFVPKFHVIPLSHSNIHHSSVHTDVKHYVTNDNINIPIISQTVSHSSTNISHPTPTIPILVPYPHNLVPLHDLSVIPLQKTVHTVHKIEPKFGHYRVMEKRNEDNEEPVNIVRTIYGGFGTGLYFGGQGAGHGFHIYG